MTEIYGSYGGGYQQVLEWAEVDPEWKRQLLEDPDSCYEQHPGGQPALGGARKHEPHCTTAGSYYARYSGGIPAAATEQTQPHTLLTIIAAPSTP